MRMRLLALSAGLLAAPMPTEAHDWYMQLTDRNGRPCCNGKDCQPVASCVLPNERDGLLIGDSCLPVPWDKVLDIPSPDGVAHACWIPLRGGSEVLCVILPDDA
ncbi:MAG: hypothetical protein U1E14_07325 [Geminicoccaceae bacterium]